MSHDLPTVDPKTADPYSLVYASLCTHVTAQDSIRRLVKPKNFIYFNTKDPLRDPPQKGNLPELMIATAGNASGNFQANNTSSRVNRIYQFMVTSGTYDLITVQQPIEFALFAALSNWCRALSGLKWCDKPFVKTVKYVDGSTGLTDSRLNRGINGWTGVTNLSVEMYFLTQDLKDLSNVRT